ncbi:hypothetical protein B5P43_15775 [Bacillus sp. SRB_336]|nr:hypothetical protein B5P43_15775 [Bacillus sp. SRB_336]
MGSFRIRKSKSFGPIRITASKRGLSASVGKGPLRVTRRADGKINHTARIPGTGISYVHTSGAGGRPNSPRGVGARPGRPAAASRATAAEPISDQEWQELLAPDGESLAMTFQREYVRIKVASKTGVRPSLKHLTIGQAVQILARIGEASEPLWTSGRGSGFINKGAVISRWILLVLVALFVCFIPAIGPFFGLAIVALVVAAKVRRARRQRFEDELVAGAGGV